MTQEKKECCPIRVHPYGRSDAIPLCPVGWCLHILLPNEKECPCHQKKAEHTQPQWEEEFDEKFIGNSDPNWMPDLHKLFEQDRREIKSFIRQTLAHHTNSLLHEIVREVEAGKLTDAESDDDVIFAGAYNAAKDEDLAIIKKHITPLQDNNK